MRVTRFDVFRSVAYSVGSCGRLRNYFVVDHGFGLVVPVQAKTISKQCLTVHVSDELVNRVKNVVYWTPGLTLAGLAEKAFAQIVEELEKKRGEPFPQRQEELKGGRPLK